VRPIALLGALCNPLVIGGTFFFAVGMVTWLAALSGQRLSTVYPLAALAYVLVTGISIRVFHDPITPFKVLGIVLIIAGVSVIQMPATQSKLEPIAAQLGNE
jgi:drug/metabolite transporter (DMT)-like permease